MTNTTVTMEVTPQEAIMIQNFRGAQEQNELDHKLMEKLMESFVDLTSQLQDREMYMEKYMGMKKKNLMAVYADAMGDDFIAHWLRDGPENRNTRGGSRTWELIRTEIERHSDEHVIDILFDAYVPPDEKRGMTSRSDDAWWAIWRALTQIRTPVALRCPERFRVIGSLFESYISPKLKRMLFLEHFPASVSHNNPHWREALSTQIVDMIMDGKWSPKDGIERGI